MAEIFGLTMPLWEIGLRGTVVYLVLLLLVRFLPKRNAGHISPNDLLTLIVIGGVGTDAIMGGSTSVGDILLLIAIVVFWAWLMDALEYHVPAVQLLMRDSGTELIEDGRLLRRNMRHEMVTEQELMAALRKDGIEDPGLVQSARIEADGEISVIRKGSVLAVSSPLLASLAMGEKVDPEELGGWRLHAEVTGLADAVADTDEEALDLLRRFLDYLPSHQAEAPPVRPVPAGSGDEMPDILSLLPESRTRVYDMRRIVRAVVDRDSFFELKARFGKVAVTGLARLAGHTVGVVATNPLVKGGALDTDACEKITGFLVLCDSFNIPIVMLVDTPGFAIGTDAERKRAPGKIMNFMNALALVTVPKLSIVLRKSYGQAYLNMGGGRNSDEMAAWPTAEISFMDPQFAVKVVHGLGPGEPGFEEAFQAMSRGSEVWDIAAIGAVQSVIRPQDTRHYLIRMLQVHRSRMTNGVGRHLMSAWPTSF